MFELDFQSALRYEFPPNVIVCGMEYYLGILVARNFIVVTMIEHVEFLMQIIVSFTLNVSL